MKKLMKYVLPSLLISTTCFADKVKLLEKNDEALQARVDLIQNAKKEIFVEYYEVASDSLSLTGLSMLRKAAEGGVKVKILIDNMHNSLSDAEMAAVLGISDSTKASENIEIKVFNPLHSLNPLHLTYRNHDKLMNIDGEMMIVGGRNVAKNYFGKAKSAELNFKDADALVVGDAAKESKQYFMDLWTKNPEVKKVNLNRYSYAGLNNNCSGEDSTNCINQRESALNEIKAAHEKLNVYLEKFMSGKAWVKTEAISEMFKDLEDIKNVKFAYSDPSKSMKNVENKLSAQIMQSFSLHAKENILIVTPYLYPTEDELKSLEKLSAAGIKIKIVTNSLASTDVVLVHVAYLSIKKRLTDMGIEIYEFKGPEILHCKGVVIDDKISMIGSFNFDRRSALINREIGVRIGGLNDDGSKFTKEFVNFINEEIIANSTLVSKDKIEYSTKDLDDAISDKKKKEFDVELKNPMLHFEFGKKQI